MRTKKTWIIMLMLISTFLSISPMAMNSVALSKGISSSYLDNGGSIFYDGETGNLTASFNIQSVALTKSNLTLYIVVRSPENKIKLVGLDQKDIKPNEEINLKCVLKLPKNSGGDITKVMLWETATLAPIIEPFEKVILNPKPTQSPSPTSDISPTPTPILDPLPAAVVLTADQYIISDDGIDSAVFAPKVYNKYNQLLPVNSSDMYYYVDDYLYNNSSFTSTSKGIHSVYAQYGAYTSGKISIKVVPRYSISLSSDKLNVVADGVDTVTLGAVAKDKFGNLVKETDITYSISSNYPTYYTKNNTLTFSQPGTYSVIANWNGLYTSNVIRITVGQYMKPVITANKTEILADGIETITFSTIVYDANSQPISYTPSLSYYVNDSYVAGNTYTTTFAGDYKVYAKVNDFTSNVIPFKANPVILKANPGLSIATYPTFETTLDGSKSTGKPTKPITSYEWRFISKPQGSNASLSKTDIVKPVFTPDIVGDYVFGLKVSDGNETSEEQAVTIKAKTLGDTTDFVDAKMTTTTSFPTGYDYNDYIPLSDGWVVAKNTSQNKVLFINGLTGNKGKEFELNSTPDRLAIDFERNLIVASLSNIGKIAKINIFTGEVSYISINGPAKDLEMGENGVLFVGGTDLHIIDIEQNKIASTLASVYSSAMAMAYDKVGNNLIISNTDSYSNSYRYIFDEENFTLRLAQTMLGDSSKYRKKPKVSNDGKHLLYQYSGNILYDYDCNDINITTGQYNTINTCYDVAFSLDSSILAADNGSSIVLFDTANRFNISTIGRSSGNYSSLGLSFSRGGKFIYNFEYSYSSSSYLSIYPNGITQAPVEPVVPITKPIALISGSNTFVKFTNVFDASNSRLSGGDALTYTWSLVSKPEGSSVLLSDTNQKTLSFTADVEGEYKVSLVVNNGKSDSEVAYRTIQCKKIDSTVDDIDLTKISNNMTLKYSFKGSIPLCDGWIITANSTNCAVITNTLTGAVLKSYQLTGAPVSMALDSDTGTLLVTMSSSSRLAKINIYDETTTYIDMPSTCSVVVTADKDKAFVKNNNGVSIVNYVQNKVLATASVGGSMMVFDNVNNFLFTAVTSTSPSALYKYLYDPTTNTITSAQSSSNLGSNGLDLRISPDGKHLVFCTGSGNGNYVMFDIDPKDITKSLGQWNTSAYPTSGYFTYDSKYFIGSNGSDIKLFDVENHYLIATVGSFSHDYEKVYFSRGSKLIYYFNGSVGYVYKNTWIQ